MGVPPWMLGTLGVPLAAFGELYVCYICFCHSVYQRRLTLLEPTVQDLHERSPTVVCNGLFARTLGGRRGPKLLFDVTGDAAKSTSLNMLQYVGDVAVN